MPVANVKATRSVVTFGTLQKYVKREVEDWIRKHRDPSLGPAIHISLDGGTENMPLAHCVAREPRTLLGSVPPLPLAKMVEDGMTLRSSKVGYRWGERTPSTFALFTDEHSSASRLVIYDDERKRLSAWDHPGIRQFEIDRPTARHGLKLIVITANSVYVINPLKASKGEYVWYGTITPPSERIDRFRIIDEDNDGRRDISITTTSGSTVAVDFEGEVIQQRRSRNSAVASRVVLQPRNAHRSVMR